MAIYNGTNGNDNFFPLPSQFNTPFIAYGNGGNDILDFRKSTADNDIVGGTSADNTTGGSDTIYGGSGNDYILGGSTGSLLIAGTGSTTLMGGAGNDTLNAGPGNDELDAGAGKNTINAGAGNDLIYVGDNSTDTINNVGAGAVSLFIAAGATANVSLAGNWTPNNQTSNSGSANIYTNGKNVDLSAITGVNGWSITDGAVNATFAAGGLSSTPSTIIGSNANDTIISGIGGDVIYGGNGGHNTFVNNGLANDIEGRNGGNNTIVGFYSDSANLGAHGDTINGGTGGNNTLQVNPTDLSSPLPNGFYGLISNIQNITTTNAATTVDLTNQTAAYNVTGGNGQNTLISGNGNDSLTGGVGVDKFIISGTGTETINNLGQGADILNVSNAAAIVNATLAGNWIAQKDSYNDGVTTLYDQGYTLDLSRIISGHGFDIVNTGAGASITGSQYADSITGGAGNDSIYGFNNQDTVNGGGGVNTLELKGNELATPVAAGQITNIQNIVLNGAGQVDITNLTGVSVTGSSGQDTLIASTGSNTLTGGLGADLFEIKGGNQVITDFGTGADNLQVTGGTINITLTSAFTAAPSTSNTGGTVNLSTNGNGLVVDLRKAGGAAGFGFDVTNTGGADTIYASKFADTINAVSYTHLTLPTNREV